MHTTYPTQSPAHAVPPVTATIHGPTGQGIARFLEVAPVMDYEDADPVIVQAGESAIAFKDKPNSSDSDCAAAPKTRI